MMPLTKRASEHPGQQESQADVNDVLHYREDAGNPYAVSLLDRHRFTPEQYLGVGMCCTKNQQAENE